MRAIDLKKMTRLVSHVNRIQAESRALLHVIAVELKGQEKILSI